MLMVLLGLGYLYIGAVLSYITTYRDSQSHQAAIHRLERENTALKAQRASLLRTSTLERAARELGMIRPGERPYIIEHLPRR
jgi:cell division protein FtsB